MHYDQSATLTSAFNVLSVVVSALAGTNKTFDPNVLRVHSYIHYTSTGQQDVLGKIFNVAQRLMVGWELLNPCGCRVAGIVNLCRTMPAALAQWTAKGSQPGCAGYPATCQPA